MLDGHADRGVAAMRITRYISLGDVEMLEHGGDIVAIAFVAHRRVAQRGAAMSFQVDADHLTVPRKRADRLGHGADVHQAARHHDDRFALAVNFVVDAQPLGTFRVARGSGFQRLDINRFWAWENAGCGGKAASERTAAEASNAVANPKARYVMV